MRMRDWNAIVTVQGSGWKAALRLLRGMAEVEPTAFYNVLLLKAADPHALLKAICDRAASEPEAVACLARVVPVARTFVFQTPEEFEARVREEVAALAPSLAGKSFYVRVHRRGFKGRVSSHAEEQLSSLALLEALERAGTPGRVTFEDPDAVVLVETIGSQAGLSVWSREDLRRYPFIRPG
jgi:tRNA(Ser,Leu) C12 N-acetylase TAN1